MPKKKIKDLKLHYLDEGKGTVIVLIHGNYSSSLWWQDVIALLKKNYRLIVPDLRGRGDTKGNSADHTMEMLADDLHELLRALNIKDPFYLVGHSLGASVATQFALNQSEHKNLIKSFVMIDPGWVAGNIPDSITDKPRLAAVADDEKLLRLTLETLIAPKHPTGRKWEKMLKASAKQSKDATMRSGEVYQMWNVLDKLPQLSSIPILIMRGELDKYFSPEETSRMIMEKIPNVRYVQLEGVGHSPSVEAPDKVVALIREFIEK